MIEILDDDEEDMLNEYKREEVLIRSSRTKLMEPLLSWKATREDLGELKLLTDDLKTMSCIPPWKKRNS